VTGTEPANFTSYEILNQEFYARETPQVAIDLLGKYIIYETDSKSLVAKIVETEAYLGGEDPASHAATKSKTNRNSAMYQETGMTYVYLIYGRYYCLNIVTESDEKAGAVLIRAVEPVFGIKNMRENRGAKVDDLNLTNGPGKLCQAFGFDMRQNKLPVYQGQLTIRENASETCTAHIGVSRRIGISKAKSKELRYFIIGNKFVSGKKSLNYRQIKR